jgi:ketosteroid isomerase-like protein
MSSDRELRTAIDRQDVGDVLVRYVHALDRRDWAALARCFAPDAVFVHPGGEVDAQGIIERSRAALEPLDASQHLLGSILVSVEGDTATAISYFHAQHVRAAAQGGELYVIAGTYRDRLRRDPDGWVIVERVQEYSWRGGNPDVIVRQPPTGAAREGS